MTLQQVQFLIIGWAVFGVSAITFLIGRYIFPDRYMPVNSPADPPVPTLTPDTDPDTTYNVGVDDNEDAPEGRDIRIRFLYKEEFDASNYREWASEFTKMVLDEACGCDRVVIDFTDEDTGR